MSKFIFYLIIFTIPYYRYRIPFPQYPFIKLDYVFAAFLLIILFSSLVAEKRLPESLKSNIWPWFFLFFFINVISALLSKYPAASLDGLRILSISALFVAFNLIFISRQGFERTLPVVIIVSVGIAAFITGLGYFMKLPGYISDLGPYVRGVGPTIGANNMALMCIFAIPILVHFFLNAKAIGLRTVIVLAIFVILFGAILTYSRGGFLNLLVTSMLILIENREKLRPQNFGIFVAAVGIMLITLVTLVPGTYFQRQKTLAKGTQADSSTQRRTAYLIVGFHSFLKHPVLGTGPTTFKKVWVNSLMTRRFKMEERPAHNTYMDVLVGSGILGLTSFLLLLWRALNNFSKAKRICWARGDLKMASLIGAYRISYVSVIIYFFAKSGLNHKYYLLALALSEIALRVAGERGDIIDKRTIDSN